MASPEVTVFCAKMASPESVVLAKCIDGYPRHGEADRSPGELIGCSRTGKVIVDLHAIRGVISVDGFN